jgi:acetate kinase
MKILVLNSGSSSVKFQVLEMENETLLLKGLVEKIGSSRAVLSHQPRGKHKISDVREILTHEEALRLILETLVKTEPRVVESLEELDAVGHRVVHGGEEFSDSVLLDRNVVEAIRRCSQFAPLHNPHNLKGIEICTRLLPGVPQVGVFDTAFHHHMPPRAYLYGLPLSVYRKLGIRRYGFHGTSHRFVAGKAAAVLGKPLEELRLITCHLGNGASIAAVDRGVSVDTTMGFTPLEGLVMGTRCGDLDPAVIPYLMQVENLTPREMDTLMNKQSGLLGLTETTNDVREILEEAERGSEEHRLALEVFTYRIRKYIGSYLAVLGGADAIVFTGGIGTNSASVRRMIGAACQWLDVGIDDAANSSADEVINTAHSSVDVWVIPTDEEVQIASHALRMLKSTAGTRERC